MSPGTEKIIMVEDMAKVLEQLPDPMSRLFTMGKRVRTEHAVMEVVSVNDKKLTVTLKLVGVVTKTL